LFRSHKAKIKPVYKLKGIFPFMWKYLFRCRWAFISFAYPKETNQRKRYPTLSL